MYIFCNVLRFLEVGCGSFNWMVEILSLDSFKELKYTGVDVVPSVINNLTDTFRSKKGIFIMSVNYFDICAHFFQFRHQQFSYCLKFRSTLPNANFQVADVTIHYSSPDSLIGPPGGKNQKAENFASR